MPTKKFQNPKFYSGKYLLDKFIANGVSRINMYQVSKDKFESGHFLNRLAHPVRHTYIDIPEFDKYIINNEYLTTTDYASVSTTYQLPNNKFKAFIGLDVEVDDDHIVDKIVQYLADSLHQSIDLFKTDMSYHLFIPDIGFDNDLDYVKSIFNIVHICALFQGDHWVSKYNDSVQSSSDYGSFQRTCQKILDEVGHYKDRGAYTFFDLRHVAHGIIEYERSRNRVYKNDGVRTQLFFRITTNGSGSNIPYFLKRFV